MKHAWMVALPLLGCTAILTPEEDRGGSTGGRTPAGETPSGLQCSGPSATTQKRLVRLTFNQQVSALGALFGPDLAQKIALDFELQDKTHRTFPPLANPREGAVITSSQWQTGDNIAQTVAKSVREGFAAFTGCSAGDLACAELYLQNLASSAFRRPLVARETARLATLGDEFSAAGASAEEVVQYGVYALLSSPQFLYRTEFGEDASLEGRLTNDELASALSFFLSDGPPDPALRAAAASGKLGTPEGLADEVTRLLGSEAVRENLEAAMFAYFHLAALDTVVIDPSKAPEFDTGTKNSMYHEGELFIRNTLWSQPLGALLTSRKTVVNDRLAKLYGITFPPSGAALDADGFALVELPETRAGLLTQAGFLTARSRPDQPSVVGRGLAVNAAFLCAQNPPFPEDLSQEIANVNTMLEHQTERQKADYRGSTQPCAGCHTGFDPYGLALENFDIIGKYRTQDEQGRPIDASVTLPANAGSVAVPDAARMAQAIAGSPAFAVCMTKNVLSFALGEGGGDTSSCETLNIAEKLLDGERDFPTLIREIVLSDAFGQRLAGGTVP